MFSRVSIGALALLACLLMALDATGGKGNGKGKGGGGGGGGGGGDPTGTIHFALDGDPYTMDADGGNKTALPLNVGGEPSRDLHGGNRWFLQVRGEQLYAVRGDGNEAFTVQLTTNADLVVSVLPVSARWGVDDVEVSWIAQRADIEEGGIYAADIAFDAGGDVTGLTAQPATPLVAANIIPRNSIERPDIRSHDWSPDGDGMVYDVMLSNGVIDHLTVVDFAASSSTELSTSVQPKSPLWSPDGSKIAFGGGSIYTINPDGTGEKRIIRGTGRSPYSSPKWSPTGSHLIVVRSGNVLEDVRIDIYRFTAGGGGKTNLTSDVDTRSLSGMPAGTVGWR